jgi:Flp pilus assembly secretin CpaC
MKILTLVATVLVFGATPGFALPAVDDGNRESAAASADVNSPSVTEALAQDVPPPAAQSNPPAASTTQAVTAGAVPLRVMVGKSLLINTTERLKRVSVTDPTVADAITVTPTQVLVNGLAPGEVSLLIWDELERSRSFDLRVDVDITAATE